MRLPKKPQPQLVDAVNGKQLPKFILNRPEAKPPKQERAAASRFNRSCHPYGSECRFTSIGVGINLFGQFHFLSQNEIIRLMDASNNARDVHVRRGTRLEYFTIAYNSMEGLISIVAGLVAGSVSLIGFGFDSMIEVASGGALLWRLHHDADAVRREKAEKTTLQMVGWCFVALSIYILYDSGSSLLRREAPERSIPGIIIAALSVIVMPVLAAAKKRVADGIGSAAMQADSRQTDFCTYLSAILLCGLLLNALLGWWWADPAAALAMVPIILNEGVQSLRGKKCRDECC